MASSVLPADTTVIAFAPLDVAKIAARMIGEQRTLSALCRTDLTDDIYTPGRGMTVNVRVPAVLTARVRDAGEKATGITVDDLAETIVPVTLSNHVYSAVSLSEKDLSCGLVDYSAQVIAPQTTAVVEYIENQVVTLLQTAPTAAGVKAGVTPADGATLKALIDLRAQLRANGTPISGVNVAVGTGVYAQLLKDSGVLNAAAFGGNGPIADGQILKLAGMNIIESARFGANEVVAFHRDGVVLAVRPPAVDPGVSWGATVRADNFGIRVIRDYDSARLTSRSVVSTFAGAAFMPTRKLSDGSAVTAGGALRVANLFIA